MGSFEPLPAPRHKRRVAGDTLTLVLPPRRMWFQRVILCVWLVGWGFGAVLVPMRELSGQIKAAPSGATSAAPPAAFLIMWCLLWYGGGLLALLWVLWQICGREVVTAKPDGLFLRREVFGLGRTRGYVAAQVRNLRLAPRPAWWEGFVARSADPFAQWLGEGAIAFDYGSRTVRFGAGVDEAEAADITATLQLHLSGRGAA